MSSDEVNICNKYGCDYQKDFDGEITCTLCGAKHDVIKPSIQVTGEELI